MVLDQTPEVLVWYLSLVAQLVKNPAANAGDTRGRFSPQAGKIPWRRKRQTAPVFLPGKFHGYRRLVGYSPRSHKELDMTDHTQNTQSFHNSIIILL